MNTDKRQYQTKGPKYNLKVTLDDQKIILKLIQFEEHCLHHFTTSLTLNSLPQSMQTYFQTVQQLFDLFSEQRNFEVDPNEGTVVIYGFSYQKKQLLKLKTSIKLQEMKVDKVEEEQYFIGNVKHLKKSLQLIRGKQNTSKEKEQKLRKIQKSLLQLEENSALLLKEEPKKVQDKKLMELQIIKTSFVSNFSIEGRRITYKGQNKKWTQILFDILIEQGTSKTFKFQIKATKNKYIIIGVVDAEKQKKYRCSFSSGNAVGYIGSTKLICYGKEKQKQEGNGFKEGEKVAMEVNAKDGTIKWLVNDKPTASISLNLIKQSKILVPYLEFGYTDDCVEFLSQ